MITKLRRSGTDDSSGRLCIEETTYERQQVECWNPPNESGSVSATAVSIAFAASELDSYQTPGGDRRVNTFMNREPLLSEVPGTFAQKP